MRKTLTTLALVLAATPLTANASASEGAKLKPGYLSDPDKAPTNIGEALFGGKINFNNRLRFEFADTTSLEPSTAVTNRLRLGYATKAWNGLSGYVEMEAVGAMGIDNYRVPQTGDGGANNTVIADPPGVEMNQVYGKYTTDSLFDSDFSLTVTGGRQRITLDDSRFIGNVGWRQFEQTYDAVRVETDLGIKDFKLQYAYVWGVQRIFADEAVLAGAANWESDSHLINLSYTFSPEFKVTPFLYLLDFDNSAANSVDTYGVRLSGTLGKDKDDAADLFFDYEFTYAYQEDGGQNPTDFEADFIAAQLKATKKGLGWGAVGYQLLGSDDGTTAFRFPLGTNHKFQGWADNFLSTPAAGLQDLYVAAGTKLPGDIKFAMFYHWFWTDEGGTDLGNEFNVVASKKINSNWSVLSKAAFYDGHSGQPDTTRFWLQTEFKF